jgi:hypothetical protein
MKYKLRKDLSLDLIILFIIMILPGIILFFGHFPAYKHRFRGGDCVVLKTPTFDPKPVIYRLRYGEELTEEQEKLFVLAPCPLEK